MKECRREKRIQVIQPAQLLSRYIRRQCVALDVSPTGAHLLIPGLTLEELTVIDEVTLVLSGMRKQTAVRRWFKGEDVGFEFTGIGNVGGSSTLSC